MANQPSGPPAQTTKSTEHKAAFIIAFFTLVVESAALVTSTTWESVAPQWASLILDERGPLLAVAASIALILYLLWSWQPAGAAIIVPLFGGALSFAAAAYSIESDDLSLGAILTLMALPLLVVMAPYMRWPRDIAGWMSLSSAVLFFSTAIMFIILGIKPLTEALVVGGGIRGPGDLVVTTVLLGIGLTVLLIVFNLAIQGVAQVFKGRRWSDWLPRWMTRRQGENRAQRRQRDRQRRRGR